MKNSYFFFPAVLICLLIGSCNLINPAEPVPSFIHIQKIYLSTDSTVEGSNSSKITDAWVYIDGKLQGAYELPVTLPVLSEGSHDLMIKAGIKVNGIAATRAPYPFYEPYKANVTLSKGQTITVNPTVHYVSNINWSSPDIWMENFDDPSIGMSLQGSISGTDTNMILYSIPAFTSDPNVFEGRGSGVAYIASTYNLFETMSSNTFLLPHGDSPVFLEMNYKCNHDFVVGVFAHSSSNSIKEKVINIHASPQWNKIYVYMSPTLNATTNAPYYTVFFGMLDTDGENGLYLNLDNIKLIHY